MLSLPCHRCNTSRAAIWLQHPLITYATNATLCNEMSSEFLTVGQAAQQLGVSRSTIWRWIDQGRLAAFRMGARTIRLRSNDVAALPERLDRHPDAQADEARPRVGGEDPWEDYDPKKALAALRSLKGIFKGVDTELLKKDLKEARGQAERRRRS